MLSNRRGKKVSTINCYKCNDEVLDRESVNADPITKDGGSFCHKCYTIEREGNK